MMNKRVRKVLLEVRDRVEQTDWTKGTYRREGPEKPLYCLVGLVNHTATGEPFILNGRRGSSLERAAEGRSKRAIAAKTLLVLLEQLKTSSIENWNDNSRRKRSDVIALIDKALD